MRAPTHEAVGSLAASKVASRNTAVSKPSRSTARNAIRTSGRPEPDASAETAWSATATPVQMTTAAAVPIQTRRSASRRPCWPRNAAMIPTISAASSPSRSPITNVGSTRRPLCFTYLLLQT